MQTNEAADPEPRPAEPEPFAVCRFCLKPIGRVEQCAVWRTSKKMAHLRCYDAHWAAAELADRVGVGL